MSIISFHKTPQVSSHKTLGYDVLQGNTLAAAFTQDRFYFLYFRLSCELGIEYNKDHFKTAESTKTAHTRTVLPDDIAVRSPLSQHIQCLHSAGAALVSSEALTQKAQQAWPQPQSSPDGKS